MSLDKELAPCIVELPELSSLTLRIKSFKDVEIHVPMHSNVSSVKELVRRALGTGEDRYLRLICKGRLLAPDSAALQEFSVENGDVLHAVLAAAGVRGGQQAALSRASVVHTHSSSGGSRSSGTGASNNNNNSNNTTSQRRHRGTIVGPGGRVSRVQHHGNGDDDDSSSEDEETGNATNNSSSNSNSNSNGQPSRTRMGFDRLRGSGLSRSEITAIRAYFSRHVDRMVAQTNNPRTTATDHSDEPDLQRRRWLQEEDWMALQGPSSEFRLNLNSNTVLRFPSMGGMGMGADQGGVGSGLLRSSVGTDRDFLWGFLLGFFVGFVMLVWVWMPTVPHKQKLGILTGISFQLALNVLRQQEDEEDLVDGE